MYVCAACVLRVYMRGAAVCDGRPDTYTCVRCNCRTRQTGYPSAPRHQHQPPGHRLQHQTGSLHAYRSDGNTILRLSVRVRLFALPPTTILTFAFLFSSILRPFLCLFFFLSLSVFLSIYLSLPATSALTSLRQTREYAQSSNRAYCQGYTPINPEVPPSNGQLENRLGFPRNHPARPPRPLAPSRDKRTIDYRVLLRFQLLLWYTSTCAFWRHVIKHKCDNYKRIIRSHLSTE